MSNLVVTESSLFFICGVVTSRTSLVCIPTYCCTGGSLSFVSNLVVTESCLFSICCIVASRTSLVCIPTYFCTGRILSLVRNCSVTCSLDRLSLFLAASATSVCFCSFGGTTGLGSNFTIAPFVTESCLFSICCIVASRTSLVCIPTYFCTGRILSLVRNCSVTCSLDRLSLFLAASATSVCFCSFGGTTGLGSNFALIPFVTESCDRFSLFFATIITSYFSITVLGTSCINFSYCSVLVACSLNSLFRNCCATIITSYCDRTVLGTSCINFSWCGVFVSTSVSYFDSCNSRLTVCCCTCTRVANGKCYEFCVVNFYNSTRFNDCTIECKASGVADRVSNLYRNNSCACR